MAEIDSQKLCRRCLYKDMSEEEYQTMIGQHIDFMDADDKADDNLYESRLSICRNCEKLLNATCMSCGCYVEIRAAIKKSRCPGKKW